MSDLYLSDVREQLYPAPALALPVLSYLKPEYNLNKKIKSKVQVRREKVERFLVYTPTEITEVVNGGTELTRCPLLKAVD